MPYDEDENYYSRNPHDYLSVRKRMASSDVHIPNKNESKLLRKLMSKTGLTESELREHKVYRKMLSKEQKKKGKGKSWEDKRCLRLLKNVLRDLKLPKEHPDVKKRFLEVMKDNNSISYGWSYRSIDEISNSYFNHLLKIYKK